VVVRVAASLARKPVATVAPAASPAPPAANPFLPYDPAMLVQTLPPDHVALLNKYCVVPHHLVIATAGTDGPARWPRSTAHARP
jgi:sulfate adenylyltransferase (ADP) / ATP adenylyltransferase